MREEKNKISQILNDFRMGLLKFEGREYNFTWVSVAGFFVAAPLFTAVLFYFFDWVWLHEVTAKITIYTLNLFTGSNHEVFFVGNDLYNQPWKLRIFSSESGNALPTITFTKMCTGIHAVLMFIFITLFTPHSTVKETTKDILPRKVKAILITSSLFYVVNIFRMWLQLYLYSIGYKWDDIHYSISAASSFIAIAAILLIHKYVPEFIMTLLWIGDEIKANFGEGKEGNEDEEKVNEEKELERKQDEEGTGVKVIEKSKSDVEVDE